MCIKFRDTDNRKPTKEELKLHIIENLIDTKFKDYNTRELEESMYGTGSSYSRFSKIYNWICERVFEE